MKTNKIQYYTLLLVVISIYKGYSQQAPTATGGNAVGSGGSVAYSIGQIDYNSNYGTSFSVAQGVQQPYEIASIIDLGLTTTAINLIFKVFPNPTENFLMLEIGNATTVSNQSFSYTLFDANGKLLKNNAIVATTTAIQMEQYPTATYLLKVNLEDKEIKTFKIIKK